MHYPIALEGALKLKEISYIHAEAYPAGELKHGPLALVDAAMPVVVIAPNDTLLEKVKSNMQEVRARGGELFVFADQDSNFGESEGVHVIRTPRHAGVLSARSCMPSRCSCWPTTPRWRAAPMSTSRATWPSPSPWNKSPSPVYGRRACPVLDTGCRRRTPRRKYPWGMGALSAQFFREGISSKARTFGCVKAKRKSLDLRLRGDDEPIASARKVRIAQQRHRLRARTHAQFFEDAGQAHCARSCR